MDPKRSKHDEEINFKLLVLHLILLNGFGLSLKNSLSKFSSDLDLLSSVIKTIGLNSIDRTYGGVCHDFYFRKKTSFLVKMSAVV